MPNRSPPPAPLELERAALKASYLVRLKDFVQPGHSRSTRSAVSFGRAALKAQMTTIEIAVLHEQAIVAMIPGPNATLPLTTFRRAGRFLLRVLVCFEQHHQRASTKVDRLALRASFLRQRAQTLARSNRKLEREVVRRKASESAAATAREQAHTHLQESAELQTRLRHLTHSALNAQEEDRRQISRDLHDAIMQTLVGINVELAALGTAEKVSQRAFRKKLAQTQRLIQLSVGTVHRFARDLRPAILDDLGLLPALRSLIKNMPQRKHLNIRITSHPLVEILDCNQRTAFFRVIQEALNNVVRHAGATQVHILFSATKTRLRAEVIDDGKSFDPTQINQAKKDRRLGLIGMHERMEMIGGTLTIDSQPAHGTTVCAEISRPATPGAV